MGSFYGSFDFYGKNCSFYGKISIDDKPHVITNLTYKTYDGSEIIKVVVCVDGKPQEASPTIPDRQSTAQYNYIPVGWSMSSNSEAATSGATSNVTEDRTVFAAYSKTVRTYTATFVRGSDDGSGTLYTCNVEYGQIPIYAGETPTSTRTGYTFSEWSPAISAITENTTYTAIFEQEQIVYNVYFYNGSTLMKTEQVPQGGDATPPAYTPVDLEHPDYEFTGWQPGYINIQADTICYAQFEAQSIVPTATTADGAYGVEWNYADPSPVLTRKGLAASFSDPTPATSVSGSGSSPFDNIAPWKDMKMYNVVGNTLVPSTDPSFNPATNDTVVYIPEFYYTAYKDTTNSKWLWAISPTILPGYKKHPGSGKYVGRYYSNIVSNIPYSKSGVEPTGNVSRATHRNYSSNKGDGWRILDFVTWSALQMLYLVEFANFNSQANLGYGWNTGSVGTMGGTDGAVYHTVQATGAHNQYRFIEDPLSNMITMLDGGVVTNNNVYVATDPTQYKDTAGNMISTGIKIPTGYVINSFAYIDEAPWAFIPNSCVSRTGNETKFVTDEVANSKTGYRSLASGGSYSVNDTGGFFYFNANFSGGGKALGSRLIKDIT